LEIVGCMLWVVKKVYIEFISHKVIKNKVLSRC
jgi:hypothetical protein